MEQETWFVTHPLQWVLGQGLHRSGQASFPSNVWMSTPASSRFELDFALKYLWLISVMAAPLGVFGGDGGSHGLGGEGGASMTNVNVV